MELKIHQNKNGNIAELISKDKLSGMEDFLDLIGNAGFHEANKVILHKENISDDFFNLKNGIAGDILQKFSTYQLRLAIIGNFSNIDSKSLRDFIRESNRIGRILFLEKKETAIEIFEQ